MIRPRYAGELGNDPSKLDTNTIAVIESHVTQLKTNIFFPFAGNGAIELAVIANLRESGYDITATLLDVNRPNTPMPSGVSFTTRWEEVDHAAIDMMIAFNPVCEPYFSALAYPTHLEHSMKLRSGMTAFPIQPCPEGMVLCSLKKAQIPMLAFINRWGAIGFDFDPGYFAQCITRHDMSTYKKLQAISRLSGKHISELVVYCD